MSRLSNLLRQVEMQDPHRSRGGEPSGMPWGPLMPAAAMILVMLRWAVARD